MRPLVASSNEHDPSATSSNTTCRDSDSFLACFSFQKDPGLWSKRHCREPAELSNFQDVTFEVSRKIRSCALADFGPVSAWRRRLHIWTTRQEVHDLVFWRHLPWQDVHALHRRKSMPGPCTPSRYHSRHISQQDGYSSSVSLALSCSHRLRH